MQDAFNIHEGSVVFQNWEVTRRIGFGASGTVYDIRKSDSFIENTSVVKVIYIPPDYSMEELLKAEGMSSKEITDYVRDIVDTLIDEVKIMISLKEFPYIVRCEDHELICSEDETQWCILIRMEKLTPLLEYRQAHPMTERDVLKLAMDMAKTLQLFEKNGGIIHRDIKPQNLFVSPYGDYKLGDFGIARICSAAASAMSRKGTEEYMAPEVYWNEEYDRTVDVYSLGLVLYQLLNKNRLPFFPLEGSYNRSDRETAFNTRMNRKTPIKPPVNASSEFANIILKMCAPKPEDRYWSASDLLSDLQQVKPSDTLLGEEKIEARSNGKSVTLGGNQNYITRPLFPSKGKLKPTENTGSGTNKKSDGNKEREAERAPKESSAYPKELGSSSEYREPIAHTAPERIFPRTEENESQKREHKDNYKTAGRTPITSKKKTSSTRKIQSGRSYNPENDNLKKNIRNWRKVMLLVATALVVCAGVIIPLVRGHKYSLKVTGGSGTGKYTAGSIVNISADSIAGSAFSGWKAEGISLTEEELSAGKLTITMPRSNASITASYEKIGYKLKVKGAEGSGTYYCGDTVKLHADDSEAFTEWIVTKGRPGLDEDDLSQEDLEFEMPAEDVTISLHNQYTLTVNGGSGFGRYDEGDEIFVSADEQIGSTFTGWTAENYQISGEEISASSFTVVMPNHDVTISAIYEGNYYSLTVNGADGTGLYAYNESIALQADDIELFEQWTIDNGTLDISDEALTSSTLSFIMPAEDVVVTMHSKEDDGPVAKIDYVIPARKKAYRAAFLIPGSLGDHSIWDSANEGLSALKKQLGQGVFEYDILEMGDSVSDMGKYSGWFQSAAEGGSYDVIITGSWIALSALEEAMESYPDQKFILFDEVYDFSYGGDNLYNLLFNQNESAYLAGACAALLSEENRICFLGGMETDKVNDCLTGFTEGARAVKPAIQIDASYLGNDYDISGAKELAKTMFRNGADVGFSVAGEAGKGMLEAASETGSLVIGSGADEASISPSFSRYITTSTIKRVCVGLTRAIQLDMVDRLDYGTAETLGLSDRCVGLVEDTHYMDMVPEEIREQVTQLKERIADGQITVSSSR